MNSLGLWSGLLISAVGLGLWGLTHFGLRLGNRDSHGRSRWARGRDLRALKRPGSGDGIVLGWLGRQLLKSPAEDNVLAFGVQRSGKTSTLVVPTLLEWQGAALATSTKEELVLLTGRHRARRGEVLVFAPLDASQGWVEGLGLQPVAWNPLREVDNAGAAAELADHFTALGKDSGSAHWYLSAANLLTALFLHQARVGGDLRTVLTRLNETAPRGYLALAVQAEGTAREILRGIGNTPEREAGSIASTARSSLSLWLDERVARATSAQTTPQLDLDRVLAEGLTVYLVAPAEEADRCRPLFSALIASLLRRATTRARGLGGVLRPRLLLALDEVANFARIPRLDGYISTGPGQGIQSLLCFHDLAQLEAAYGEERARTIWNNCRARLLLPGQGDLKTLDHFSRAIGNQTVYYDTRNWNTHGSGGSESRIGRPLCSPDDLRVSKETVLVYANAPPVRLRPRRWDQVPGWRAAVLSPPGS
jgi:type IV secretion system protein VirD4